MGVWVWVGEFIRDVIAVTQYSYATPTIIMIKQLKWNDFKKYILYLKNQMHVAKYKMGRLADI